MEVNSPKFPMNLWRIVWAVKEGLCCDKFLACGS